MSNSNDNTFKLNRGLTKPFKTINEQLDLLESRGLIVCDRDNALDILNRTNASNGSFRYEQNTVQI